MSTFCEGLCPSGELPQALSEPSWSPPQEFSKLTDLKAVLSTHGDQRLPEHGSKGHFKLCTGTELPNVHQVGQHNEPK